MEEYQTAAVALLVAWVAIPLLAAFGLKRIENSEKYSSPTKNAGTVLAVIFVLAMVTAGVAVSSDKLGILLVYPVIGLATVWVYSRWPGHSP